MFSSNRIISILFILMLVSVAGCRTSNSPPYAVIGPAEADVEYGLPNQQVPLITEAPGFQLDPDGDNVLFKSSSLPPYLTLDEVNGILIANGAPEGDLVITVWTEDEHGLKSEDFVITLHFIST